MNVEPALIRRSFHQVMLMNTGLEGRTRDCFDGAICAPLSSIAAGVNRRSTRTLSATVADLRRSSHDVFHAPPDQELNPITYRWIYFDHHKGGETRTAYRCSPEAALARFGIDLIGPVPDDEDHPNSSANDPS